MVDTKTDAPALVSAAFQAILAGDAPRISDLASASATASQNLERLIGRSLVLDAGGRIVAAAGLSLVPARQHRLTVRGRQFWTWCAYDAIGIPAGLGEDAVAETACYQCGTPVIVEFHAGQLVRASHADARIWDAQRMAGAGTAGPPHCALMNLFCSAEHLVEWQAAHPNERGQIRTLAEVAELGRAEWGALSQAACCDPEEYQP
jgi:alkylmercury lyase